MSKELGKAIRKDFPYFQKRPNTSFLDSAASSLTPVPVIEAISRYYQDFSVNIHRGVYEASAEATKIYEETRQVVRDFINAENYDIIFTRNATEGFNLVAGVLPYCDSLFEVESLFAWKQPLQKGDVVVISESEHHANIVPWHLLRERFGVHVEFIPVFDNGVLDTSYIDVIKSKWKNGVKIISLSAMSNVTGILHDLSPFEKLAREYGALFLVDAAQAVCHEKISAKKLNADMIMFSAHKMLGPTGIGVLAIRKDIADKLPPYQGGGDMILSVAKDKVLFANSPQRFEAGTPHIAGVFGLQKAIEYLQEIGLEKIAAWEKDLGLNVMQELEKVGALLRGPSVEEVQSGKIEKAGVISFELPNVHPHDAATIFDKHGVAIRAGHHCCQVLMRRWQTTATCRASFYLYNDYDDIEKLMKATKQALALFHS
ncbi:MAG: cysteine desulfurase [Candidatus Hydrogenedentota bacterium]|nr:MAG: cysteine desulfurase [Candidatus Hydrogenedentota bacterium]